MRVFISCVSTEFRTVREELRQRLTTHRDEVKVQEDFGLGGGLLIEKLDRYIRHCDAMIHLSGDGLGSLAKPAEVAWVLKTYPDLPQRLPMLAPLLAPGHCPFSYTQWECYLALYHGITCQICFAEAGSRREAHWQATDADRAAQRAHEQRLKSRGHDRLQGAFITADRIALEFLQELRAARGDQEAPPPVPNQVYRWPEVPSLLPHNLADREDEVRLFADLVSGRCEVRALLLYGPSNQGKSKLMARFEQLARGLTGLAVGFGEFKSGNPLTDVLDRVRRDLRGQCFERYDREAKGANRLEALRAAFLDDLQDCPEPVLLLLDTYQEASADTQRWVHDHLLDRCGQHPGCGWSSPASRCPAPPASVRTGVCARNCRPSGSGTIGRTSSSASCADNARPMTNSTGCWRSPAATRGL
ncbi:ATP-binding protein [uncultured Thiodictyon sp.]|jgi:hypothetical protein|uniref:ATP-binding protein n=1 Tax=uncultured Thiodictyon sp. TaxID=1846217 RepID=UPI0025DE53C3|nr:ATP-binding protein [uncultured Thiodictyon sp.]